MKKKPTSPHWLTVNTPGIKFTGLTEDRIHVPAWKMELILDIVHMDDNPNCRWALTPRKKLATRVVKTAKSETMHRGVQKHRIITTINKVGAQPYWSAGCGVGSMNISKSEQDEVTCQRRGCGGKKVIREDRQGRIL
jgi:hypothetical protein